MNRYAPNTHGGVDAFVTKLNSDGSVQWQMVYGGSNDDNLQSIVQTSDSGFAVAGRTLSNDGDVQRKHLADTANAWVMKLSAHGAIEWQQCLGGYRTSEFSVGESFSSVLQSPDGGFVLAGSTDCNNGDVSGYHGGYDMGPLPDVWIVKLNSSGKLEWQECLGGTQRDHASCIITARDGSYTFAGFSLSKNGDLTGLRQDTLHGNGWVVNLSPSGSIVWQSVLGGSEGENLYSIIQTNDGGYVAIGGTVSNEIPRYHPPTLDVWLARLDSSGKLEWQEALGGPGYDMGGSIIQTSDGGFAIAGVTDSSGGDVSIVYGDGDAWIVQLDSLGGIEWEETLGGPGPDGANSILQSSDGGLVVGGRSGGADGHCGSPAWVWKLAPESSGVAEEPCCDSSLSAISVSENPLHEATTLHFAITDAEYVRVEVFDVLGNRVWGIGDRVWGAGSLTESGVHSMPISLEGQPSGIYYLRITLGTGEVRTMKLVKE